MRRALPFAICFAAAMLLTQPLRSDDNLRIHRVITALNYAVSRTTSFGSASNGRGLWRRVSMAERETQKRMGALGEGGELIRKIDCKSAHSR
jgi:hypothetical protein